MKGKMLKTIGLLFTLLISQSVSQINDNVISLSIGRMPDGIFGLNYQHKTSEKSVLGLYWHSSLGKFKINSGFEESNQPTDFMVGYSYYFKQAFDSWSIAPVTGISFSLANHTEIPLLAEIAHRWVFRNAISLQVGGALGTAFVFSNLHYENTAFRCFGICDIGYLFGE